MNYYHDTLAIDPFGSVGYDVSSVKAGCRLLFEIITVLSMGFLPGADGFSVEILMCSWHWTHLPQWTMKYPQLSQVIIYFI